MHLSSNEFVENYVLKIPPSKATGVDGISVKLLQAGIKELAPPISKLINMSLTSNQFPSRWKIARVTALFKAGDISDLNNYRPISILPVLSKIIERHVHDCLFYYLTINNLIYSNQSGFRSEFGTETAVAFIVDSLLLNLDKNLINGMVLVDYKKAFDMVDHCILLDKLGAYHLDQSSLDWFKSYLSDRKQYVNFKRQSSTRKVITDGVPQGSILGPLLFLIFINDLPLYINSQVDLFADDTTLLAATDYNDINELNEKLSLEVSNVQNWAITNKLPLNTTKTKTILISGKRLKAKLTPKNQTLNIKLNDDILEQEHTVKLLGFNIDEDLNFDTHVDTIAMKLSKRIGILKSIKSYLPRNERILFYNAMIKPLFLYCSITWTNCSKNHITKIFKLQKRCARIILDAEPRHSSINLFNNLGWLPFYVESDIRKCIMIYKRTINATPEYLNKLLNLNSQQHSRNTRSADLSLVTPKYNRTTEAGRTFSITAISLWNKLPLSFRSASSINCFKYLLYNCFRNHQSEFKQFTSFPDFKFK